MADDLESKRTYLESEPVSPYSIYSVLLFGQLPRFSTRQGHVVKLHLLLTFYFQNKRAYDSSILNADHL